MACDSARGVTVLFGGTVGEEPNRETWEYGAALDCELVATLTAKCKPRHGGFKVKAKVVTGLPEGTQLVVRLDNSDCTLQGNEAYEQVIVDDRGRARAIWTLLDEGDYCVVVRECPAIHGSTTCSP